MSSETKLIPADRKQCQSEKPNPAYGPFKMGGSPHRYVRCENAPRWIAVETKPASDGLMGTMSLCDECKAVCKVDRPDIEYRKIRRRAHA
jgi:hypothetical protein